MECIEERYMRRCFSLALNGLGRTAPNPMVGAVVVYDGKIVGEGYHCVCGQPHAEVNAISSVKDKSVLQNSTLYVSLEPCSHYGKTPPCSKLIIDCKIPRVVVSNLDPFPQVSGRGINMLQDAGVDVVTGVLEEEGWQVNKRFFTFHTKKRPYVILKYAQTADGYIDAERTDEGKALKISSSKTQMLVHKLRTEEDAILVGRNTVVLDNPSLNVRNWYGKDPVKVLIDKDFSANKNSNIFNGSKCIVFTEKPFKCETPNVKIIVSPFVGGQVDLEHVLSCLYEEGIQSLIVEGGRTTLQSFADLGLFDEVRVETNTLLYSGGGVASPSIKAQCYKTEYIDNNVISWFRK